MNLTGTLVTRGADRMNTGAVGMEEEPPVESTQVADDEEIQDMVNEQDFKREQRKDRELCDRLALSEETPAEDTHRE